MSNRAKIIVSVLAICILLAIVAISIVIVLTEPAHIVDDSSFVIEYTNGSVVADVKVTKKETNLYYTDDKTNAEMDSVEELFEFKSNISDTNGVTRKYNIGKFNRGQYIDISEADTTLVIEIELDKSVVSADTDVILTYVDSGELDTNIRFVITATMSSTYNTHLEDVVLDPVEINMVDGSWTNSKLFDSDTTLKTKGYNKLTLSVKSEVVRYEGIARLDGEFKLSLLA